MGVGDGLQSLARQEKNEEKQRAIEAEKRLLEAARKVEEEEDRACLKRLEQPTTADDALSTEHHPAEEQTNTNHDDKQIKPKDTKVKIEEVEDEDFVIPEPSAQSTFPTKNEASNESPVGDHGVILGSSFRAQSLSYAGSPAFQPDFDDSDDDIDLIDLDAAEPKYQPRARTETKAQIIPNAAGPSNPREVHTATPTQAKPEDQEAQWKSVKQLVAFRDTSVAIADDWLKSQNVKLTYTKSAVRDPQTWRERSLYWQGREDAKKIDVRRKRIKGTEDDY
ncbi:hypothetical protein EIP86_002926 [Pleurotus ostreatoroseus]|nr:hypothetical protein EIP86_002926 [Pleurotus ostreatoroseus]